MDPVVLQSILVQLAMAFPEHRVTLVLRCPEDAEMNAVGTSDPNPSVAVVQLGNWVLSNFMPEVRH